MTKKKALLKLSVIDLAGLMFDYLVDRALWKNFVCWVVKHEHAASEIDCDAAVEELEQRR